MLSKNPCRYCCNAYVYKNTHTSGFDATCLNCENRISHNMYLLKHRKYRPGEKIRTLDELLKQEWVIWNGKARHIKFIMNFQLGYVITSINYGRFYKAIKNEQK